MNTAKGILSPSRVIHNSPATKAKLKAFSATLKGKNLFPKSNKSAEEILSKVKSFPKA